MNPLFQAAIQVQSFFQTNNWSFCFIGGIAVLRWGQVRMTQDLDISLFAGFGPLEPFIEPILAEFPGRITDAGDFARQHRVLLVRAANDVPVDIVFAGLPFESDMMVRATPFAFLDDCDLITCSAEDLIVQKAVADRPIDWADIEGILARQGTALKHELIIKELEPFCLVKQSPETMDRIKKMVAC